MEHGREILRLNPGDNLEVPQFLFSSAIDAHQDEEAERLMKEYPAWESPSWLFNRALVKYRLRGDTPFPATLCWRRTAPIVRFSPTCWARNG
jgi:hypothetical protein